MTETFGGRLSAVFAQRGHLCVGVDPHPYLLAEWGLPDSAIGVRAFGLAIVEAAARSVGIVKPQIAFFERHGSAGYAALEAVLSAARGAGLLVIADVKRGDVGSTVDAYGEAWLTPGSSLEVDAMTAVAFQGLGSLDGPHELALAYGKGLFVLAATSNPEAFAIQSARLADGRSVAASIVKDVKTWNAKESGLGSTGVVLGATIELASFGVDPTDLAKTPILAPGFGFQGASVGDVGPRYGAAASNVVIAASRSLLSAGPAAIASAIDSEAERVASAMTR